MFPKIINLMLTLLVAFAPMFVLAQNNASLPIASTLEIFGARIEGGEVVIYNEATEVYSISRDAEDKTVYGVTAFAPALVFSVGSGTVPVVTAGATHVLVNEDNGSIKRGDILTSSGVKGIAMKADLQTDAVFAVALEDYVYNKSTSSPDTIIAEIGIEQARALQGSRRELEKEQAQMGGTSSSTAEKKHDVSYLRAGIAALIASGGLFFVFWSFRSTIAKGVVSIGRNPRARASIMTLAFGNIIFALILCAVALLVAVAVLVLPIQV